jgi:4-hydroxy-4-methyl-2-oxoglutarate aldolase
VLLVLPLTRREPGWPSDTTAVVKAGASLQNLQERLIALSSADLSEALGKRGALDPAIRHLAGGKIAGPAVTASCEPYTVAAMFRALRIAQEGDVLCVQGEGDWAYFGERAAAEAVRRKLAGVVVDGYLRDLEGIAELGLGVFARGSIPVGGTPDGAGEVNVPLRIGAQDITPGDWLIGDLDGLVRVPHGDLPSALAAAEAAVAVERLVLARIASGESLFDIESHGRPSLGTTLDV